MTADQIFLQLNQLRRFEAEGFEVHCKKWQWYVNGKAVTPVEMRDAVFAYAKGK